MFRWCILSEAKKKVVLFPEIGPVKIFYHSPARIVECVSEYIFNFKKKTRRQKMQKKLKKKTEYLWKI